MNVREFLGIDHPVIQAPMAGVQDSELAVAVSGAGGLGSLPCAMLGSEQLRGELASIRSQTEKPVNLNFFCHQTPAFDAAREARWRAQLAPFFAEYGISADDIAPGPAREPFSRETADLIEGFQPEVVSFHFGLPAKDLLERVRSWGTIVLCSATTVAEALWLEANGADAIIAQGLEAGGHRGMFMSNDLSTQVGTFALLPRIIAQVKVPVIAAGGIADAAGVRAALSLGAIAAQVGTAYLLCPETKTSQLHRAALRSDAATHTAVTNVFSGRPARGIVNRAVREIGPMSEEVAEFPLAASAVTALRSSAESAGSADFTPLWCGQNASGCKEISAAILTRELANVDHSPHA